MPEFRMGAPSSKPAVTTWHPPPSWPNPHEVRWDLLLRSEPESRRYLGSQEEKGWGLPADAVTRGHTLTTGAIDLTNIVCCAVRP